MIKFSKLSNSIQWGLLMLLVACVVYLMFNPELVPAIFGSYDGNIEESVNKSVQLKGQLLIENRGVSELKIKLDGSSDIEGQTFAEGKFEFKGVSYENKDNVKWLMIRCPNGRYVNIERIDLNNVDLYPLKNGWVDLGVIRAEDPCGNLDEQNVDLSEVERDQQSHIGRGRGKPASKEVLEIKERNCMDGEPLVDEVNSLQGKINCCLRKDSIVICTVSFSSSENHIFEICANTDSWETFFQDRTGKKYSATSIEYGGQSKKSCFKIKYMSAVKDLKVKFHFDEVDENIHQMLNLKIPTTLGDFRYEQVKII